MASSKLVSFDNPVKFQKYIRDRVMAREDGCWQWQLATNISGHGKGNAGKRNLAAHRIAYAAFVGPAPEGLNVLHRCGNHGCCNPEHLYLGTHLQNAADREAHGRTATGLKSWAHNHKDRMPRGSANGSAKLNEQKVKAIRAMLAAGVSRRKVADAMEVGDGCILGIQIGKTWTHVV